MKKFLALIVFSWGLIFALPSQAQEKINNYQVNLNLTNTANLVVSERIEYDFGSESRHGIFRQLPIFYQGKEQDFSLDIEIISITDEQGEPYKYKSYQEGDYLVLKIGDAQKYVSGQKTYLINYQVQGAVLFFDNYDELYWNVIGTDWQVPIERASAQLVLPQAVLASQAVFKCWSGLAGTQFPCQNFDLDISGEQLSALSIKQNSLLPQQAVTILAQLPKGVLDETLAQSIRQAKEMERAKRIAGSPWAVVWPILVFALMYYWWSKKGRDPQGRGNIIAEYDVPNDLRPAEVGAIVYEQFANNFLTAEIIYLATHGYLKITRQPKTGMFGKEDYLLTKLKEADTNLKNYEQDLLKFLFSKASGEAQVKISELKDDFYTHLDQWKTEVWSLLKAEKYYQHTSQGTKVVLWILGLVMMGIALPAFAAVGFWGTGCIILSGLIVILFSRWMSQKTSSGVLTKEYLLGLKEYLNVAEKDRLKFHNAPDKDPQTFEKLLPYAIVFGVEEQWAEKFKDIYTTPPNWYSDPNLSHFNTALFIGSLHNFSSNSIHSLATPTHSGAGSGGGFSGGGFGGGGGGSW